MVLFPRLDHDEAEDLVLQARGTISGARPCLRPVRALGVLLAWHARLLGEQRRLMPQVERVLLFSQRERGLVAVAARAEHVHRVDPYVCEVYMREEAPMQHHDELVEVNLTVDKQCLLAGCITHEIWHERIEVGALHIGLLLRKMRDPWCTIIEQLLLLQRFQAH